MCLDVEYMWANPAIAIFTHVVWDGVLSCCSDNCMFPGLVIGHSAEAETPEDEESLEGIQE